MKDIESKRGGKSEKERKAGVGLALAPLLVPSLCVPWYSCQLLEKTKQNQNYQLSFKLKDITKTV